MKNPHTVHLWTLGMCTVLTGMVGCTATPTPGPEAILAGRWELVTSDEAGFSQSFLEFDEYGNLSTWTTVVGGVTLNNSVSGAETTLTDSTVVIRKTTGETQLTFTGTLNDTNSEITGSVELSFKVPIIGTQITFDQGDARLVRQ